ncbi:UDP-N-acetylmuramoyl-L-alanyl-D-glutamate--2,6-diaminopimelate ligase [Ahniella affigens]|uniref:UDP-N-acetylmuramoyl-L-alanyl-D-glutamate--2,6-diaminopimelate ligase n=1 Tax=Ahniella affigens TaxID=2021234 RepID=A0A2P1PM51_9GAMM|nr:UDP-N-acetylmuramoyl-L-alanyl-D-glutamate--2,6-diaminopimelate ligase [Ahniella affigens]AVP95913.1 UDP-N-acetylmuramoyl-L-alanyl-D-glutamate--2,6-diaminopimelate ligase [Ahniella affigens]
MSERLHHLWPELRDLCVDFEVQGFAIDSRAVQPGFVFMALQGQQAHGLQFAAQALQRGARLVIAEPGPHPLPAADDVAVTMLVRAELREELGRALARWHAATVQAPVLTGVTGTNGKTSTVQLMAAALERFGQRSGTIGTLGTGLVGQLEAGERTTPDVIATHAAIAHMAKAGAQQVVMEVSSHALEQGRVAGLEFAFAAFSNLTRDHLDYHGSMEAYGAAKARLFHWSSLRAAVINIDDAFGRQLLDQVPERVRTIAVSSQDAADLEAQKIIVDGQGLRFELVAGGEHALVQTRLLGRFNVDNLLLVAGLLWAQGIALTDIADAFADLEPVAGRMNRVDVRPEQPLVVVDYAHTPDGLDKALTTLRAHCEGRLFVVFGCGGDRDPGKRSQMGALAAMLADHVIVSDDNPRTENGDQIVAMIVAGCQAAKALEVERDRRLAIRRAIALAKPGDVVLIAGKGHEPYQEIAGRKLPFDDRAEAELALKEAA